MNAPGVQRNGIFVLVCLLYAHLYILADRPKQSFILKTCINSVFLCRLWFVFLFFSFLVCPEIKLHELDGVRLFNQWVQQQQEEEEQEEQEQQEEEEQEEQEQEEQEQQQEEQ